MRPCKHQSTTYPESTSPTHPKMQSLDSNTTPHLRPEGVKELHGFELDGSGIQLARNLTRLPGTQDQHSVCKSELLDFGGLGFLRWGSVASTVWEQRRLQPGSTAWELMLTSIKAQKEAMTRHRACRVPAICKRLIALLNPQCKDPYALK